MSKSTTDNLHLDLDTTAKERIKQPKLYRVLLVNDDFTPMDFVVLVLMKFFSMDSDAAVRIMLDVHNKGTGECGVYTRDIAETKMQQANSYAREHKHPLLCQIEQCTI